MSLSIACVATTSRGICGAKSDALLCRDHTSVLRRTIAQMPARIRDLELTATRQSRADRTPSQTRPAPPEHAQADEEERLIPSHLRSRMGRITLPTTSLPFTGDAAKLHAQAVNAVTSWARHIAETRGVLGPQAIVTEPTGRRVLIVHRNDNRAHWHTETRIVSSTPVALAACTWLVAHIDSVRLDEAAGEMFANATELEASIDATVDVTTADEFVGLCATIDVRAYDVPRVGAPCSGLTCPHESCEQLRRGEHVICTEVVKCNGEMYISEGQESVTCPKCGAEHTVAEVSERSADEMAGHLGTTRQVAGFLRNLEITVGDHTEHLDVTVDKVDGWLRRGRITDHGADANRHRLVRVGEVREYAEDWQRRRAARRKITAA